MVIFHHLNIQYGLFSTDPSTGWLKPFFELLHDGNLGVNVFFILSGFLITELLLFEEKKSGRISIRHFYLRRAFRILPAYYFYLIVLFTFQLTGQIKISLPSWLTSITFTKYLNWNVDWLTSHAWSLSIEEFFYLLWPLAFYFSAKGRLGIALIFSLISPISKFIFLITEWDFLAVNPLFNRMDAIAIGCILALQKEKVFTGVSAKRKWVITTIFLLFLSWRFLPWMIGKLDITILNHLIDVFYGSIVNILLALIIIFSTRVKDGFWYKFLNSSLMSFLGQISFSLYLWQQFYIFNGNLSINFLPLNLVWLFLTAIFSYYFIEQFFLRIRGRVIRTPEVNFKSKM